MSKTGQGKTSRTFHGLLRYKAVAIISIFSVTCPQSPAVPTKVSIALPTSHSVASTIFLYHGRTCGTVFGVLSHPYGISGVESQFGKPGLEKIAFNGFVPVLHALEAKAVTAFTVDPTSSCYIHTNGIDTASLINEIYNVAFEVGRILTRIHELTFGHQRIRLLDSTKL